MKQCLELISDQETQFHENEAKMEAEKAQLQSDLDQMRNDKKDLEIKLKSFKHKLEQIDSIDFRLKRGLESLEFENTKLNETNRRLSDEID
jgi:DNA repair ATPase RecN